MTAPNETFGEGSSEVFDAAIGQAVAKWRGPGRQVVIRVTCAYNDRATLTTCQLWSTTIDDDWEARDAIPLSGTETRLDVCRALEGAGFAYDRTESGEPRWWVVDTHGSKIYALRVRRAEAG